jgi:IS5 family transposase
MKADDRLSRCPLKGAIGNAVGVLNACGHNIRKILAYLRAFLDMITAAILSALCATDPAQRPAMTG